MSTQNAGFYEEIAKLSLNYHQIRTLSFLLPIAYDFMEEILKLSKSDHFLAF